MRRRLAIFLLLTLLPAAAERVALVVGNGADRAAGELPDPLDGMCRADRDGGLYPIEAGRIHNLAPCRHPWLLPVEAGDGVVRDPVRSAPGVLTGEDPVAAGPRTGRLQPDGSLAVEVTTAIGPFVTVLRPERLDDPRPHRREPALLGG